LLIENQYKLDDFASFSAQLDISQHNSPLICHKYKKTWSGGQRRAFFRIKSGLVANRGRDLRFMTLTSAQNMQRPMSRSYQSLVQRIRRLTPFRLYKQGFVAKKDLLAYYPNREFFKPFKCDYLKVSTSEGVEGVFHILFFGEFIPARWLSSTWSQITGTAKIVDIRKVKTRKGDERGVSAYVVNQYVVTQEDNEGQSQYLRFSNSWDWCFRGFMGVWREFRRDRRKDLLLDYDRVFSEWDDYVFFKRHPPPPVIILDDYIEGGNIEGYDYSKIQKQWEEWNN
jgi:hypothetical protein